MSVTFAPTRTFEIGQGVEGHDRRLVEAYRVALYARGLGADLVVGARAPLAVERHLRRHPVEIHRRLVVDPPRVDLAGARTAARGTGIRVPAGRRSGSKAPRPPRSTPRSCRESRRPSRASAAARDGASAFAAGPRGIERIGPPIRAVDRRARAGEREDPGAVEDFLVDEPAVGVGPTRSISDATWSRRFSAIRIASRVDAGVEHRVHAPEPDRDPFALGQRRGGAIGDPPGAGTLGVAAAVRPMAPVHTRNLNVRFSATWNLRRTMSHTSAASSNRDRAVEVAHSAGIGFNRTRGARMSLFLEGTFGPVMAT